MSTSRKLIITLVALASIATAAIGASFSSFTAAPLTIKSQSFADGALSIGALSNNAIFQVNNAIVGTTATGSITIEDTGTIAAHFTMTGSVDTGSSGALAGALSMQVYADTDMSPGAEIYNGTIAGFSSLDLGVFNPYNTPGDRHTYYFHVALPSTGTNSGDNALQGQSMSATFTWNAVQA